MRTETVVFHYQLTEEAYRDRVALGPVPCAPMQRADIRAEHLTAEARLALLDLLLPAYCDAHEEWWAEDLVGRAEFAGRGVHLTASEKSEVHIKLRDKRGAVPTFAQASALLARWAERCRRHEAAMQRKMEEDAAAAAVALEERTATLTALLALAESDKAARKEFRRSGEIRFLAGNSAHGDGYGWPTHLIERCRAVHWLARAEKTEEEQAERDALKARIHELVKQHGTEEQARRNRAGLLPRAELDALIWLAAAGPRAAGVDYDQIDGERAAPSLTAEQFRNYEAILARQSADTQYEIENKIVHSDSGDIYLRVTVSYEGLDVTRYVVLDD
jgi:hypothetical protein